VRIGGFIGMSEQQENHPLAEKMWRTYMTTGEVPDFAEPVWFEAKVLRPLARLLPKEPRCRVCLYPFEGIGGALVRSTFGLTPSKLNPQLCNVCDRAANKYRGGAEIELTMLFADVRGSTGLADGMNPTEYGQLIDRFYRETTKVLFRKNGMVEKLIGDEVTGFFVPGFSGEDHSRVAVEAGEEILLATGHRNPDGPWVPVGVGVHTGIAFVGAVSSAGGSADITVLGDTANAAAHIASQAGTGELILSEATRTAAGIVSTGMESRNLVLKSRKEPMDVWVKKIE
jgi:adenylate cyclase